MEWRAHLRSGDIPGDVEALTNLADEMVSHIRMEEFGPIFSTTDRAVGLTVSTEADNAQQALGWLMEVAFDFEAALVRVGHPVGVVHIEVGHADDN
jgi:hypothetical protein